MSQDYTIEDISRMSKPIFHRYDVTRAGLFGSFVKNTQHAESDIDFVVELGKPSLFRLGQVKQDLEDVFGRDCDVITFSSLDADSGEVSANIRGEVRMLYLHADSM